MKVINRPFAFGSASNKALSLLFGVAGLKKSTERMNRYDREKDLHLLRQEK